MVKYTLAQAAQHSGRRLLRQGGIDAPCRDSDARIPLHNNSSESRLRIIALLRKSSLFFGNARAGRLFAGHFSLVASAVANNHEPVEYITDVLLRVCDDMSDDELDALLPDRWIRAP
jgi:transposase